MKTFIVPFTALALLVGAPAAANDFVVQYEDLDLSKTKDQKKLERRIDNAAREYCGLGQVQVGSRIRKGGGECFRSARDAAREQLAGLIAQAQNGG